MVRVVLFLVVALVLVSAASADDAVPPSAPGTPQVVMRTLTSIALSWQPSTDDVGVLGYKVFRDGVEVGDTDHPGVTDSGLQPNTTYTFYTEAFDAAGNRSAASPEATVRTLALKVFVALCKDGRQSRSTTKRFVCKGHRGVKHWIKR